MLTPEQLRSLPRGLTDTYSELSEFILRDIARRIAKAAKITETAEYQMYRAKAIGLSTDEISAKIAEINGVSEEEINELIRSAAEQSDEFDRKMLGESVWSGTPLEENAQLQKLMAAEIKQTHNACFNYTQSLGFAERNAYGQVVYSSLGDFLINQMDAAHMKVVNGVTDYNTAIRQACSALAASGVRTVYYNSGHSDRIEVAVRRAVMTSVSQVTQKISEQNAEEFGADGWEISAHVGARPSHAIYQGRQYPNSKYDSIVRPLIEDYNCRHSAYPIIMGVSEPAYTEEELANIDPPPFTYEGRKYTAYEAQQQMRKMERAMRKQKDRCIVADAAGDEDTFTAASIKLRRQKDLYEDFCNAAGTYTEYERTFVAGYNRSLAAKTGAVTRKQRAFERAQEVLQNSVDYMSNSFKPKLSSKTFDVNIGNISFQLKRVENSSFNLFTDELDNVKNMAVRNTERLLARAVNEMPVSIDMPKVAVVNFEHHGLNQNAIAGFHADSNTLFVNSKYKNKKSILEYVNKEKGYFSNSTELAPYLHELGHKFYEDSIKALAKTNGMVYNKAKAIIDSKINDLIHDKNEQGDYLMQNISVYAQKGYSNNKITEVIAECFAASPQNDEASTILNLMIGSDCS